MVYAAHLRMVMGGYMGAVGQPVEEWSNTLNFLLDPAKTLNQAMADAVYATAVNYIQAADLRFSDDVKLTFVKLALVDTTGHIPGTVFRTDGAVTSGVSTTGRHPFQCSVAVSLLTGLRGPSKRGRFFMPPQNVTVESGDGLIVKAQIDAMLPALVAVLDGFQSEIGLLQVASSKGYNTQVTGIKVGRVMDTQRRRRRSLPEDYSLPQPL